MKRPVKKLLVIGLILLSVISPRALLAQNEKGKVFTLGEFQKDKAFTPIVAIESWLTYSMNEEKNGLEYADRFDASFRRLRFGAKGSPYNWLSYELELNLDRLGEDSYAATKGSYKGLDIWKVYLTAKLAKSDLIYLHAGYYWAAISRDCNTSPWAVSSFDKTTEDQYLRTFMTGKGNGIESGFGFGGLKNWEGFGFSYRVGAFSPAAFASKEHFNPLLTGRLSLSIGDPEQKSYSYMLTGNHWNARNGVTLSIGGATQGAVDNGSTTSLVKFDKSSAYGGDIMACAGGFKLEGEYFKMKRELAGVEDYKGSEWFVRCGYNFEFKKTFIEPTVTYEKYEGKGEKTLFSSIGTDETLDLGVNWYLNKDKLKMALHYLNQKGSTSSNVGDIIGLSLQVRL